MAAWFPNGVKTGDVIHKIVPGGYAVVGRFLHFILRLFSCYENILLGKFAYFCFLPKKKNLRKIRAKPQSLPTLFGRPDK